MVGKLNSVGISTFFKPQFFRKSILDRTVRLSISPTITNELMEGE